MRIKLLQIGRFYIRFDLTFLDRFNVLIGLNYCEGGYVACTDNTHENCLAFEYAEFQLGLLLVTFSFGKEQPVIDGTGDQIQEDLQSD